MAAAQVREVVMSVCDQVLRKGKDFNSEPVRHCFIS